MMRSEDAININNFGVNVIDGLAPNLKHGSLGLRKPEMSAGSSAEANPNVLALLTGEEKPAENSSNGPACAPSIPVDVVV